MRFSIHAVTGGEESLGSLPGPTLPDDRSLASESRKGHPAKRNDQPINGNVPRVPALRHWMVQYGSAQGTVHQPMNGPGGGPTKHEKKKKKKKNTHTTGPGPFCPKIEREMSKRTGVFRYFALTRLMEQAGASTCTEYTLLSAGNCLARRQ